MQCEKISFSFAKNQIRIICSEWKPCCYYANTINICVARGVSITALLFVSLSFQNRRRQRRRYARISKWSLQSYPNVASPFLYHFIIENYVSVFLCALKRTTNEFSTCWCWTTKEMNLIFCIKTELLNVYTLSLFLSSSVSVRCALLRIFIMLFTFDKHMHSHYFDCFYCNAVAIEATHTQTHARSIAHEQRKEWSA